MMQAQQQRVESAAEEARESIYAQSHLAREQLVSATLSDGTPCTIVGGNFQLTPDGRIDLANSDQTVVILHDGQKRMVTADLASGITAQPVAAVADAMADEAARQAQAEFDNGIDLVARSRRQAELAQQQAGNNAAENIISPAVDEQTVPGNGNIDTENIPADTQASAGLPAIPADQSGNPLYEQATPAEAMTDIYTNQGLPAQVADRFVANKLAEAQQLAEKLAKKEPQIGTDLARYKADLAQWQQSMEQAQAGVAFWQEVQSLAQPVAEEQTTPTAEATPVVEQANEEQQPEETPTATPATQEPVQPIESETQAETLAEETPAEETDPLAEPQPVGSGVFGDIYDAFRGKAKEAINFLLGKKSGDLLAVFHRDVIGDIDLIWGDKNGGLEHILDKHVGEGKSFANIDEAAKSISDIINNGSVEFENGDKVVLSKDGQLVTIRKNVREKGKKNSRQKLGFDGL